MGFSWRPPTCLCHSRPLLLPEDPLKSRLTFPHFPPLLWLIVNEVSSHNSVTLSWAMELPLASGMRVDITYCMSIRRLWISLCGYICPLEFLSSARRRTWPSTAAALGPDTWSRPELKPRHGNLRPGARNKCCSSHCRIGSCLLPSISTTKPD